MQRFLATIIVAYAGLSAAHWGHAMRWLHAPPGTLWCGNAVSDPFAVLSNQVAPAATMCAAILTCRCIKARRWPYHTVTAILTFVITSACLGYEAHVLGRYGLEVGHVWWLPWR